MLWIMVETPCWRVASLKGSTKFTSFISGDGSSMNRYWTLYSCFSFRMTPSVGVSPFEIDG